MKVYEFYLNPSVQDEGFDAILNSFYGIGAKFTRIVDGEIASAVYSISRNHDTHWVQLLVDDNAPAAAIKAIEDRINGLKDDRLRYLVFDDEDHHRAPIETPKNLKLEKVLEIRAKQKARTLGKLE